MTLLWTAALLASGAAGAEMTATDIIDRANKVLRGESSRAALTMTIVTPSWKRSLDIEAWTEGRQKALILIHAPPKDKGNTTLRRHAEMWLWMPKVERVMKIPPTMMHSSWQGSDFTYDDIVKADSVVKDYTHKIASRRPKGGYEEVVIEAVPKPEAPVVWGKVLMTCGVYPDGGVVPIREEDFSERGQKVRTIELSEVKETGKTDGAPRRVPMRLVCRPQMKPGQRTEILYKAIDFDLELADSFFSLSRLQRSGS